jgi:hypothetical protein
MRPGARGRPADECPYRRPFPADFDGCAAYHPAYFIPLTTGYDSMSPVWTCSNLVPGAVPSSAARFYGRCRIGDEAARVAWIDTLHAKRLSGLRTLSRELTDATAALTGELMAAKGAQLQAPSETPERDAATLRLQHLADRWLAHLDTFLRRHGAALRELDFPPEAIRLLCEDLFGTWIEQTHGGPPDIPEGSLRLFPEDVRVLLQPDADLPVRRAEDQ